MAPEPFQFALHWAAAQDAAYPAGLTLSDARAALDGQAASLERMGSPAAMSFLRLGNIVKRYGGLTAVNHPQEQSA